MSIRNMLVWNEWDLHARVHVNNNKFGMFCFECECFFIVFNHPTLSDNELKIFIIVTFINYISSETCWSRYGNCFFNVMKPMGEKVYSFLLKNCRSFFIHNGLWLWHNVFFFVRLFEQHLHFHYCKTRQIARTIFRARIVVNSI